LSLAARAASWVSKRVTEVPTPPPAFRMYYPRNPGHCFSICPIPLSARRAVWGTERIRVNFRMTAYMAFSREKSPSLRMS
jgi:hypothetical protein